MLKRAYYTMITISKLAKIIRADIPKGFNGSKICGRVLTQAIYVKPGDVVISAGWYPKQKTVQDALDKGAVAVFCDKDTKKHFVQENVIAVDDPMESVLLYENWRAKSFNVSRIAITGSVGKTTTTGLINAVVANSYKTLTHHSAANSHGAVLRNVQRLEDSHEYWVQEVGGVQPGYIESSAKFLRPNIVVLTNIGESHLNLYGTKENILKDKASLEAYAQPDGVVIINSDDEVLKGAKYTHKVITCSLKDSNADYYASDITTEVDGIHFVVKCSEGEYDVHLNLYGDYNAYNALFAIAVGRIANIKMERILELLTTYYPSGMRQNFIKVGGYSVFVDSFNAEPQTVLGSAKTLSVMNVPKGGRKIFVTGHMDKLGKDSAEKHYKLGLELGKLDIDQIILFAGDSEYTYKGLLEAGRKSVIFMKSRDDLDNWLRNNLTYDDVVFFKSGHFEASLVKTVDHVFGTSLQNEQQYNEGYLVEYKGYKIRIRQDNIAEIEGYVGTDSDLIIPERYEDNIIKRISPVAFRKNYNLRSIVIPDSVEHIGRAAFYICPKLESVVLPKNLKFIGESAFNYCKSLERLEVPNGTLHIDRRAFYDCISLKKVSLPDSVGFIGEEVFGTERTIKNRKLTVICDDSSYASEYARRNGLGMEACTVIRNAIKKVSNSIKELINDSPNYITENSYIFNLVKGEMGCEEAPLTNEELEIFKQTWGVYYEKGIAKPQWAALYKAKTGVFLPDYIGHDLHQNIIEKKVIDTTYIRGLCDKNMMPLVLPKAKFPFTLVRKLSGCYLDSDFNKIDENEAVNIILDNKRTGVVIKECRSSGGKGVVFVNGCTTSSEVRDALKKSKYITVQKVIKQHADMAKMNESSVNTIRIMTIMIDGVTEVLSAVVRIGEAGSLVDNFHSGGVSCGINTDGTLKDFACYVNGERIYRHKNGFVFADGKVPNFEMACSEVKRLHYSLPMFGIISWDICINEYGEPVVIEYNIGGGITVHQLSNGPLYGKYRERILEMVFPEYVKEKIANGFMYHNSADGIIIDKFIGEGSQIVIPDYIEGIPVVSVGESAFKGNEKIEVVEIGANIKEIGYLAFCMCKNLKKVIFTRKVNMIGRSAFNECDALVEFIVPEGTIDIGKYAFAGCKNLKILRMPKSLVSVAPDFVKSSPNVVIYCPANSIVEKIGEDIGLKIIVE